MEKVLSVVKESSIYQRLPEPKALSVAALVGVGLYTTSKLVSSLFDSNTVIKSTGQIPFETLSESDSRLFSHTQGFVQCSLGQTFVREWRHHNHSVTDPSCMTAILVPGFSFPFPFEDLVNRIISEWRNNNSAMKISRVITYHLYGRGWSDAHSRPHTLKSFRDQLSDLVNTFVIDESSEINQFVLCGISMGGLIAADYTAHFPEQIKHLITIAPACVIPLPFAESMFSMPRLLTLWPIGSIAVTIAAQSLILGRIAEQFFDSSDEQTKAQINYFVDKMTGFLSTQPGMPAALISTVKHLLLRTDLQSEVYHKLINQVSSNKKNMKWSVVWGEFDSVCSFEGYEYLERVTADLITNKTVQFSKVFNCDHADTVYGQKLAQWFDGVFSEI